MLGLLPADIAQVIKSSTEKQLVSGGETAARLRLDYFVNGGREV